MFQSYSDHLQGAHNVPC